MTEYRIPYAEIAKVFRNPRDARAFELMQRRFGEIDTATTLNVAATDKLTDAAFVTLSENAELPNERVLQFGAGISPLLTAGTISLSADVRSDGGFRITLVSGGDAMLGAPLTGFLATREWVNAQGFGGGGGGGSGTVTSVALSLPAIFTVTGSPVTTTGTLAATLASQSANLVLASPNGAAGVPAFRALAAGDIPTLNQNTTGSAATLTTGRTIGMTGDVVWTSAAFNGSGNVTGTAAIQPGVVTLAMQANMATGSLVYRKTAGAGSPEVQTLATLKTDLGLSGTNTGDQTSVTGNAGTATALQTGRTISITGKATAAGGLFDGTGNLALNVTAVTLVAGDIPNIAQSQVTNLVSDLAAKQPLDAQLTDLAGLAYTGNGLKVVRVNAGETGFELATAASGPPTLTTVEVNVGSVPKKAGKFTITGAGLSVGKPVLINQSVGPYTGKGTRADEAEMDGLSVKASVTSTTQITAYWSCATRVRGNIKFDYLVGA